MSIQDNQESLAAAVMELTAKVAALEGKNGIGDEKPSKEGLSDKISRERKERKEASDIKDFADKQKEHNQSRPTSPRRYESLKRTTTTIASKDTSPRVEKNISAEPEAGKFIDFYCWKEGVLGKIKIQTGGDFTAL